MAKKVLLIVFGSIAALVGIGLAIGGFLLIALTGGDGYFGSDTETLRTPTHALVSESAAIDTGSGADGFAATARLRASSVTGENIFLGVGRAAEVDRYLDGVAHDEVRDVRFSPFRYDTVRWDGERMPSPPGDETLWTAQASGSGEQTLDFRVDDGDYRLVVMNADGSEGVDVRASFAVRVPFLRGLGVGLAIGGVLTALLGVLLLVWGLRTKVPPRQPAWGPQGAPPGYGYGYGQTPYAQPYGQPPAYGPPGYGPPGYPAPPGQPPAGAWPAAPGDATTADPTAPPTRATDPTAPGRPDAGTGDSRSADPDRREDHPPRPGE